MRYTFRFLDGNFLPNGLNLLAGAIGQIGAYIAVLLLLALLIGIFLLVYVALDCVKQLLRLSVKASSIVLLATLLLGVGITGSGLQARSAFLTSPTYGGLSWLAHGTLLSGLWVNSQVRYDRLVMSARPALNRLFKRAGWRTVAVQPAHTMEWPQGKYFGYDRIYAAPDLGYKGQPFNWITMPDQYTLSAFQSRERTAASRPAVMAEIALISSHAPWTPLPLMVDWEQVGDGTIFSQQAREGDTPEAVWQHTQRILEQ